MQTYALSCFRGCRKKCIVCWTWAMSRRRSVQCGVTGLGAVVTLGGRRSAWHLIWSAMHLILRRCSVWLIVARFMVHPTRLRWCVFHFFSISTERLPRIPWCACVAALGSCRALDLNKFPLNISLIRQLGAGARALRIMCPYLCSGRVSLKNVFGAFEWVRIWWLWAAPRRVLIL